MACITRVKTATRRWRWTSWRSCSSATTTACSRASWWWAAARAPWGAPRNPTAAGATTGTGTYARVLPRTSRTASTGPHRIFSLLDSFSNKRNLQRSFPSIPSTQDVWCSASRDVTSWKPHRIDYWTVSATTVMCNLKGYPHRRRAGLRLKLSGRNAILVNGISFAQFGPNSNSSPVCMGPKLIPNVIWLLRTIQCVEMVTSHLHQSLADQSRLRKLRLVPELSVVLYHCTFGPVHTQMRICWAKEFLSDWIPTANVRSND